MRVRKNKENERGRASSTSLAIHKPQRGAGEVRIVGGQWRRTPLWVGSREGLRPTSERVRETLFDWVLHLFGGLEGIRVLDLFAGSGALGLEAASRGAISLDAVEIDRVCAGAIRATLAKVGAGPQMRVHELDAFLFIRMNAEKVFDLIFIDPPFAENLQEKALEAVSGLLSPEGLIYVESPECQLSSEVLDRLGLTRVRCGFAGRVAYELLSHTGSIMSSRAKADKAVCRTLR